MYVERTVTAAHAAVVIRNSKQVIYGRTVVWIDHPARHVQTATKTTVPAKAKQDDTI